MGQQRMNTLVRSLLLRRTKDQKSTKTGEKLVELPQKHIVEHKLKLEEVERQVYEKVFSFSQQAMLNYMQKHKEDKEDAEYVKNAQEDYFKFDPKVSLNSKVDDPKLVYF